MVVEENKPAEDGSVENQSKKAAKKLAKDAAKAAKVCTFILNEPKSCSPNKSLYHRKPSIKLHQHQPQNQLMIRKTIQKVNTVLPKWSR